MIGFCYPPDAIPLPDGRKPCTWPPSLDCRWTDDPKAADFFLFPMDASFYSGDDFHRLPYFSGNELRHVFVHTGDTAAPLGIPSLIFRCSTHHDQFKTDPGTFPWPYPVEDFGNEASIPAEGFSFDLCFHGFPNSIRAAAVAAAKTALNVSFEFRPTFWGFIGETDAGKIQRAEMVSAMRKSRLALAPRGGGMSSYRFYEALTMARVPVLIADGHVLPFGHVIPWDDIIVRIAQRDLARTGSILRAFLDSHGDRELIERGRALRAAWGKYLDRRRWPVIMAEQIGNWLEVKHG